MVHQGRLAISIVLELQLLCGSCLMRFFACLLKYVCNLTFSLCDMWGRNVHPVVEQHSGVKAGARFAWCCCLTCDIWPTLWRQEACAEAVRRFTRNSKPPLHPGQIKPRAARLSRQQACMQRTGRTQGCNIWACSCGPVPHCCSGGHCLRAAAWEGRAKTFVITTALLHCRLV